MTLQESNNAFMQPNHKKLTLTFSDGTVVTNSNIVQESLMIDEALCSGENLLFGACESSCFSIRIVNTEQSFEGLDVDLFLYMETEDGVYANEDDDYYITDTNYLFEYTGAISEYIGKYKVLSDTPTSDRVYRDLVCYDYMYFLSDTDVGEWYSGITFPISVKDFRDSLFEYMNFTQEETTLINDNYMIVNKYETTSIGFREVIESICSLNGVFGHINNRGIFTYISLPSADTLEVPYYINGSSAYEDYETDTITGILACNDTETGNLVGTDDNVFTLTGNICIIGAEYSETTTTALQNLLDVISTVSYRPYKVQMYGNPYLELGTNITFSTKYCTVNSIVATRVLTGIQAMRDEYRALGDRVYPTNVNSLASEVRRIKGSTISLKSEVTETRSEVVLKVTSGGKIVQAELSADASTGSEFKVGADNISFIANNKIELSANSLEINSTNFKVNANGNITATGGTIGGFTIGSTKLYNGMTSFSDTTHNGVYVGTNGIALGKGAFKVDNKGALTATSGTIAGLTIGSYSLSYGDTFDLSRYSLGYKSDGFSSMFTKYGMMIEHDINVSTMLLSCYLRGYQVSSDRTQDYGQLQLARANGNYTNYLPEDIINSTKWDGTNTSLKSALADKASMDCFVFNEDNNDINTTIPSGSWTTKRTLTLTKGYYVIQLYAEWASVKGYSRQIGLSETNNGSPLGYRFKDVRTNLGQTSQCWQSVTIPLYENSDSKTYYVVVYHNSDSACDCITRIGILKIAL